MDPRVENLANVLGVTGNAQIDPQDKILSFNLTIREATLVLNKLNVANFVGFGEASQAMQIFAKISATVKEESQKPDEKRLQPVRPGTAFAKPAPSAVSPAPAESAALGPKPTPIKEEVNTAAPMAAVDEVKQQPVSEDAAPEEKPATPVDDAPPEDAGVFSVINKSGDI